MVITMKQKKSPLYSLALLLLSVCILLPGCARQESSSSVSEPLESLPSSAVEPVSSFVKETESSLSEVSSGDSSSSLPADVPTVTSSASSAKPPSKLDPTPSSKAQIVSTPATGEHFFDDAVFIGDSVSLKLKYYAMKQRKAGFDTLGQAQFLVSGSLGSGNALKPVTSDSVHPTYQGQKMPLEDAVIKSGANKIFIMLGMNDVGLYGVDKSIANLDTLIDKIQSLSPNTSIYLQSVTPMLKGKELKQLNNVTISEYNAALLSYCDSNGYTYLDIATIMMDADGSLIPEFCSDPESMGIHFTDLACAVWVDILNTLP